MPSSPDKREPAAVIGLGAIGTVLAAALAEAGREVVVCGRRQVDRVEVTDGDGTRTYPVRWVAEPADVAAYPWVVLATKMHHTADVAPWLDATTDPSSRVVVAQNGIDHAARVGPLVAGRVVPTVVYINAERTGRGAARARPTSASELLVPDDEDGRAAAEVFTAGGLRVEPVADFRTAAWRKLLTNVVGNPITALTGRRAEVLHEPRVAELAMSILRETVAVARADGADLPDGVAEETLAWLHALPPDGSSSMLQDREAGRPLEYDGLTGAVVRLAEAHGVPVDANRTILALLSAL
ncbi:MAG TPA: 2-dehydropantoate 2-reductase [Streptosporangiales bacterium]